MRSSASFDLSAYVCFGLFTGTARAETCYGYGGFAIGRPTILRGLGAYCSVDDECMPNRLCRSRGDADNILVRGSCSSKSWDEESNCAEICNFDEIEQNRGLQNGVFPRVEICGEGVYCCRQGTTSCCDRDIRLVVLDEDVLRLSEPPALTTSTTSSTTSTISTTTTSETDFETSTADTTSTIPKTSDSESTETSSSPVEDNFDDGDSTALGLKVGLGVGIPLAMITTALATWFFFSKRRNMPASGISELAYSRHPYSQDPDSRDPEPTMHQSPIQPDQSAHPCPPYNPDRILRQPQPQELETRPVARPWSFAPSDEMTKTFRMSNLAYEKDFLISPSSQ